MFCSPSYLFMYLYVKLRIKGFKHIIYVLGWTCVSILMEWIGVKVGLYHYDKGYKSRRSNKISFRKIKTCINFTSSHKRVTSSGVAFQFYSKRIRTPLFFLLELDLLEVRHGRETFYVTGSERASSDCG
jgi:hypothetical protein